MSKELLDSQKDALRKNAFATYCNIEITDIELDHCDASAVVTEDSLNAYGLTHGGFYFTLADTCAGFTARADGRKYVTQQSNIYYISSTGIGHIYAKGTVVKRSKSLCIVDVEEVDETGKLLIKATFNYFCLEK